MIIKTFTIRLADQHKTFDENTVKEFMQKVTVRDTKSHFVEEERAWQLLIIAEETANTQQHRDSQEYVEEEPLTEKEQYQYDCLREWRNNKAAYLSQQPFMIASNNALIAIAKADITHSTDLLQIKGFKEKKVAAFGEEIVALLNSI